MVFGRSSRIAKGIGHRDPGGYFGVDERFSPRQVRQVQRFVEIRDAGWIEVRFCQRLENLDVTGFRFHPLGDVGPGQGLAVFQHPVVVLFEQNRCAGERKRPRLPQA